MYSLNYESPSGVGFSQNAWISDSEVLERVVSEMPKIMKTKHTTVSIIPNMTTGHLYLSTDAEIIPPIATKKATMLKDMSV